MASRLKALDRLRAVLSCSDPRRNCVEPSRERARSTSGITIEGPGSPSTNRVRPVIVLGQCDEMRRASIGDWC